MFVRVYFNNKIFHVNENALTSLSTHNCDIKGKESLYISTHKNGPTIMLFDFVNTDNK